MEVSERKHMWLNIAHKSYQKKPNGSRAGPEDQGCASLLSQKYNCIRNGNGNATEETAIEST